MPVVTSFNLEKMDQSDKSKMPMSMPMPISIGSHSGLTSNEKSPLVSLLPRYYSPVPVSIAPYPYQVAFSGDQAAQMGLFSNTQTTPSVYMGYRPVTSTSGLSSLGTPSPIYVTSGSQPSAAKKRPAPKQGSSKVISINQTPQQSSSNKRPSQAGPLPKATESFESVRSKLRESLAASLAMVPDQQNKPQVEEKNSPEAAVGTTPQAEVSTEPVEVASEASDPSSCKNSSGALVTSEQSTKCNESQQTCSDTDPNENTNDQTDVRKHEALDDQSANIASLDSEAPFISNAIMSDELLQGHGLCWASDVDTGDSETIMNPDLKKPKLSHEEVTEKPKIIDEEAIRKPNIIDEKVTVKPEVIDEEVADGLNKELALKNAESLAIKIEAELFKLFGGVNKKYKEKARSLLFNLKDRSNPELRERVLSGDIAPERLCSMTAEELASKELSQWRLAKAEEFAQMVVLPDSDIDVRRLVKKNHKGEFQVVEIEHDDSISNEVAVGQNVRSRVPSKSNGKQTQPRTDKSEASSLPQDTKASESGSSSKKGDKCDNNDSNNLDSLLNEKTDFMQDLMVDDLKDTELLPPIVSLDEFMLALDSEPPFDNLSEGTKSPEMNADNSEPEIDPESDSLEPKTEPATDKILSKLDSSETTSRLDASPHNTGSKEPKEVTTGSAVTEDAISQPDGNLKSSSVRVESAGLPDTRSRSDHIWDGLLQLNISALASVVGIFRSGEKISTQEWPSFIEIKGRVRLDAFEKFLQELRLSKSRAMMISQFCWKEGSHESGRLNMCETINSYIADQRVGFAEPAAGVELYFCPPHPKTTEMLGRHLPTEYTETIRTTINGLIGVVIWRRPHVTAISPRLSSHHKRTRKPQQNVMNSSSTLIRPSAHSKLKPDEVIDDVPPGFGPGNGRDEDDLPEFDFSRSTSQQKGLTGRANPLVPALPLPPARPVEKIRLLIEKYGKGEQSNMGIQSWNDDDDIPEWQPNHNNKPQLQQQQQLPPPPPPPQLQVPPLPPQPHMNYQQQVLHQQQAVQQQQQQPFFVHQNLVSIPPQQQQQQHPQLLMPLSSPQQMMPQQMGYVQSHNHVNMNPGWQQGGQVWPPQARGPTPADAGGNLQINGMMQPCNIMNFNAQPGQFYGVPSFGAMPVQQNEIMGWRPDVPRNSGI